MVPKSFSPRPRGDSGCASHVSWDHQQCLVLQRGNRRFLGHLVLAVVWPPGMGAPEWIPRSGAFGSMKPVRRAEVAGEI